MDTTGKSWQWHLAQNESEADITNFELQLWRVFYGFIRWQEECQKSVDGVNLTGHELAVLHVIRMKNKPKAIADIGRILNRNDMFNINYSLRKLMQQGLVKKSRSGKGTKTFFYEITAKGIENTEAWSKMRHNVLITAFMKDKTIPLKEMANNLMKIKSIYDEADSIVAYTSLEKADENEIPNKTKKK